MSKHRIHEPYAGYDTLVTYLRSQTNKSYKGFLEPNRNIIVEYLYSNPIWINPDSKKVNLERNKNRLQSFWEGVIRNYKRISVKIKLKEFVYKIIFLDSLECIPEEFNPQNSYLCGICQNEILQLLKAITILLYGHLFYRNYIEHNQIFSNPYCTLFNALLTLSLPTGVIRNYKRISVKIKLKEFVYKIIFLDSLECIPEEFNPQNSYLCGICQNEILQLLKAITILLYGHLFYRNYIEHNQIFSNPYCTLCQDYDHIDNYDYHHYHNDGISSGSIKAVDNNESGSSNDAGSSGTVDQNDSSSDNGSDNDAGNGVGSSGSNYTVLVLTPTLHVILRHPCHPPRRSCHPSHRPRHPSHRPRHPSHRSYVRNSSYYSHRVQIYNYFYNQDHVNSAPIVNNHHENDDNNHTMMDNGTVQDLDILEQNNINGTNNNYENYHDHEPDNYYEDINNNGFEDINNEVRPYNKMYGKKCLVLRVSRFVGSLLDAVDSFFPTLPPIMNSCRSLTHYNLGYCYYNVFETTKDDFNGEKKALCWYMKS
ncbi:hypothetical protein Glove_308g36 [Diversispora epigaea]|uniref:Uncharacterized protein n=1 Tax=Diversispora epigaea TaxID=1348612 RepID=A0A397HZ34_9GLOM|nr:hypothetical protein Glove_308g36 [Diversispora epigaea]